jgi:flagellar motility protein MotE (MotC chaperone)
MNAQSSRPTEDRILLSRAGRSKAALSPSQRRSSLWTIAGGVVGSTILLWIMVQLGQASNNPKDKLRPAAVPAPTTVAQAVPSALPADAQDAELDESESSRLLAPPTQGPALDVPREVIGMLDLRKRDLDRREDAVRQNEERLMIVRAEVEKVLAKNEALEKRIESVRAKADQQAPKERLAQAQKNQLAKMYEAMPSEDAAVRLERMPDQKAIEILRLVKTKSAAAILAQVKPEHAAKLSVQLLADKP